MKTDNRTILKIFFFVSLATIVAFSALNAVFVLKEYDTSVHYFNTGFEGYKVLYIAMAVFAVLTFAVGVAFARKEKKESEIVTSSASSLAAMITGFLMAGSGIINLLKCIDGTSGYQVFKIGLVIISIICSVYFIYLGMSKAKNAYIGIPFGCITVIWLSATVLQKYFEMDTPLNSPLRVFGHIMMLGAVLFLVQEIRIYFKIHQPFLFFSFGIIASMLLTANSVAVILLNATGKTEVTPEMLYSCMFLALGFYCMARVADGLFRKSADDDTVDETESISDELKYADSTEEIVLDEESVLEVVQGKQEDEVMDSEESVKAFIDEIREEEAGKVSDHKPIKIDLDEDDR